MLTYECYGIVFFYWKAERCMKDACYSIDNVRTLLWFHTSTHFSYFLRFFSDCLDFRDLVIKEKQKSGEEGAS